MRYQFLLAFLFSCCSWSADAQPPETLYWSAGHRLQFSDFHGRPGKDPGAGRGEGRIAGAIIKSIVADTRRVKGKTFFVVYASMKPGLSWIAKKGDSTALRHEQGHFDICEIFARKLRSKIGQAKTVEEAQNWWNQTLDEEDAEQTRYDKANSYRDGGITKAWTSKIRSELSGLAAFENPQVTAVKLK